MMERKVEYFLAKHQLIDKGSTVIIGVSGGPDSMALLHFLSSRREDEGLKLIAVTVNHQLRGEEARADVEYVRQVCSDWEITFESAEIDVRAYKQAHKVSTQVASRILRYDIFEKMMIKYGANSLALGHHGDDQVETMLMGLMQKTTGQGLTGIPYERIFAQGKIVRPLLSVTKAEIEAYCSAYGIVPRIDPSNVDTDYTRNDLRLRVVPVLREKNEQIHKTVQQLSETMQEDEDYLMKQTKIAMQDAMTFAEQGRAVTILKHPFLAHAVSLQRRALRLTLDYLYNQLTPDNLSYIHEEIFLDLVQDSTPNKVVHFPHKLRIEKSYDIIYLYFDRNKRDQQAIHYEVSTIPTDIVLANKDVISVSEVGKWPDDIKRSNLFVYPKEAIQFPLHIRNRRDGDRMTYEGMNGSKKVKDILMDEKIPRHERDQMYLITDNNETVLWLVGLRKKAIDMQAPGPYVVIEFEQSNNKGEENDA